MSSIERTKNEILSSREIEEEEMVQELMSMGMYEDGLSYDQMKDILGFISESKHMAKMETEGRALQRVVQHSPSKSSESSSETTIKANSPHQLDVQENAYTPKPSFSYKVNHTSPKIFEQRSPEDTDSHENSPNIFDRTSQNRYKHLDNEAIFDRLCEDTNVQDSQTQDLEKLQYTIPKSSLHESQNLHSAELKVESQSKHNKKYERWRLNPLNISVDTEDVPLQQPTRPIARERAPFSFCNDKNATKMRDEVIDALSNYLEEVAKIWRNWHRTAANLEFQWGSPIKVGTANGSLDKNPPRETKSMPPRAVGTNRDILERACKRKASCFDSEFIGNSNSDEDDENDSIFVKKKKSLYNQVQSKSPTGTIQKSLTRGGKISNCLSRPGTPKSSIFESDVTNDEFDNSDVHSLYNKNQKKKIEQSVTSTMSSQYPRRIVPPLSKKKVYGPKQKKNIDCRLNEKTIVSESDEEENTTISNSGNQNVLANDQEIAAKLEKNDEENSAIKIDNNLEIKPLPVKGMASKLQKQCRRLKKLHEDEEKKKQIQEEKVRKKREEARKQKEELVESRIQENAERKRLEQDKEKEQQIKEDKWKKNLRQREREYKERAKKMKEEEEMKKRQEEEEEERLLEDNDDIHQVAENVNEVEVNPESQVNCPICNKSFPIDDIENHAAECEQYDVNEGQSNSNGGSSQSDVVITNVILPSNISKLWECQICSVFNTDDSIDYEDHVHKCLQRHKLRLEEDSSCVSPSSSVIDVPTSPVRCYLPISQQTNSEINYKAQFPSKNNQKTYSGKKRKR